MPYIMRYLATMNSPNSSFVSRHYSSIQAKWLINTSYISPGGSAIIGNNKVVFLAIHFVALTIIAVSFISSLMVITRICSQWRRANFKLGFPTRFPLYLAIADALWGISHFTDHVYLLVVQRFPNWSLEQALSMNLWFFFGYQQLMHASIAGYAYLKVVRGKTINLGKWEWKLHLLWFIVLTGSIFVFYFINAFGSTGYWMAHDATTVNGQILGVIIAVTSTFNAVCTTFGHYGIKQTVVSAEVHLRKFTTSASMEMLADVKRRGYHSTASQCITTFVWMAALLYCPLALLLWINVLCQIFLGAIEPLSCLFIAIVANSSGWANAYGFLYNEKIKKERKQMINLQKEAVQVDSKDSTSSDV